MPAISAISLSGMNAAQSALSSSATRIARAGLPTAETGAAVGAAPDTTTADVVDLLQAKNAFLANLAVFKTADRMTGSLLDIAT